jgi:hypothetical protein
MNLSIDMGVIIPGARYAPSLSEPVTIHHAGAATEKTNRKSLVFPQNDRNTPGFSMKTDMNPLHNLPASERYS